MGESSAFPVDITKRFPDLNVKSQGKDKPVNKIFECVQAFITD